MAPYIVDDYKFGTRFVATGAHSIIVDTTEVMSLRPNLVIDGNDDFQINALVGTVIKMFSTHVGDSFQLSEYERSWLIDNGRPWALIHRRNADLFIGFDTPEDATMYYLRFKNG